MVVISVPLALASFFVFVVLIEGSQLVSASTGSQAAINPMELDLEPLDEWAEFRKFTERYAKSYGSKEKTRMRFGIFRENLAAAKTKKDGGTDAEYGVTMFSDLTSDEFRQLYLSSHTMEPNPHAANIHLELDYDEPLPDRWDWRERNAVTRVKAQGTCGRCWAFAVIANIEGQWAVRKGQLLELSEEQLIDCDPAVGKSCKLSDGTDDPAAWYMGTSALKELVKRGGGVTSESDYKYNGGNASVCRVDEKAKLAAYINGSNGDGQNRPWRGWT